ncbi:MAG: hypothetical protein P4L80_09855 [Xanthobacteraceae bacterium]|nr:hypothetical protein [Xanthobacteraceae bacterium]
MHWTNTNARYGAGPQVLHWLTVVFVVAGWLPGSSALLPKGPPRGRSACGHI